MAHILVIDDEEKMRHLLAIMLERHGHRVERAKDGAEGYEKIKESPFDMVIADIKMPRMSGTELLEKLNAESFSCPMVFITAFATVDSAVSAMRLGAADYITKPFDEDRIQLTVERTLQLSRVMAENRELKQKLINFTEKDRIVYQSESMQQVMVLATKLAKSDSVVMVCGESGTGKELLARFIHNNSMRKNGRFVALNCAAISPQLVESELYGYEKGAFTGADRQTQGKFEFASGGTLFLDEIGDLPLEAQAKLLRTLQEKTIRRVGGNREITVDTRILCATNQDLAGLVDQERFRQDLFYRINVIPIQLPPLRDRRDDILPLAQYFIESMEKGNRVSISEGAKRVMRDYSWPGNVRELANAVERVMIIGPEQGVITVESLSFLTALACRNGNTDNFKLPPEGISFENLQKQWVSQALEMADNNQTQAAKLLGLTRAKFRVLLKNAQDGDG